MDWLTNPEAWIALLTLTALEIVLGIDNIIFISILVGRLPEHQRNRGRVLGLGLAMLTRILLLLSLTWVMRLTAPLFSLSFVSREISGRDIILVLGGLAIGWRYWTVNHDSADLDKEIAAAQQETTRLHSVILQVQQFEQQKARLQQRVVLIEQLRKGQTGPVHMLDQISRALPPMVWLTDLKETPGTNDVTIEVHDVQHLMKILAALRAADAVSAAERV